MNHTFKRWLSSAGVSALVAAGLVAIPAGAHAAEDDRVEIDGVEFHWAVNEESGGGAYFGGANWLVAGEVGNVHGERNRGSSVWDEQDAHHFTAESGNTTITRPDAEGNQIPATWANRNNDANGNRLTPTAGSSSWNQANISNGEGWVDPVDDNAEIQWDGAFTMVYYGGMTYWSVVDPKLTVEDGVGTITATLTGYGADMYDPSKWVTLDDASGSTIANLPQVDVTETGIETTPAYSGVEIDVEANGPSGPQNREKEGWGSFPQDWVDFNVLTGQAAYWYTSGGLVDNKKTAAPITIDYELPVLPEEPSEPTPEPGEDDVEVGVEIPQADEDDGEPGDGGGDEPVEEVFKWELSSNQASLGTAAKNAAGGFEANGSLPTVTVTDTYQDSTGWALNGQATNFTSSIAANEFASTALGWTPSATGAQGIVSPGAAVLPGATGLSESQSLASANAAMDGDVTVDAELNLVAPAETAAGDYQSTLTITAVQK